jgi:hypothetical protein
MHQSSTWQYQSVVTLTDFLSLLSGVDSVTHSTLWAGVDIRRLEDELELARATTSRLNSRVNELVAAEQVCE